MDYTEIPESFRLFDKFAQQVSQRMGIDRAQYSRVETGKSEPVVSTLEKIARALEVEVADFFKDDQSYDINSYNKNIVEKLRLIEQLGEKQKETLYNFIDMAITNQNLKNTLSSALSNL